MNVQMSMRSKLLIKFEVNVAAVALNLFCHIPVNSIEMPYREMLPKPPPIKTKKIFCIDLNLRLKVIK